MNPVPVMKLVEVIQATPPAMPRALRSWNSPKPSESHPVEVNDYPGFVNNRILMPMINEAIMLKA